MNHGLNPFLLNRSQDRVETTVLQENIEKPDGLLFSPASAGIFLLPYLFQNRDLSRF